MMRSIFKNPLVLLLLILLLVIFVIFVISTMQKRSGWIEGFDSKILYDNKAYNDAVEYQEKIQEAIDVLKPLYNRYMNGTAEMKASILRDELPAAKQEVYNLVQTTDFNSLLDRLSNNTLRAANEGDMKEEIRYQLKKPGSLEDVRGRSLAYMLRKLMDAAENMPPAPASIPGPTASAGSAYAYS